MYLLLKTTIFLLLVPLLVCYQILQYQDFPNNPEVNSYRSLIAKQTYEEIKRHNNKKDRTFDLKPYPQFIGRTLQQNSQIYLNKMHRKIDSVEYINDISFLSAKKHTPATLDNKIQANKVGQVYYIDLTPYNPTVYNQQGCGNCYAHAVADTITTRVRVFNQSFVPLSIEELTACSSQSSLPIFNLGCQGGDLQYSMWYVTRYGLHSQEDYPFDPLTLTGVTPSCTQLPIKPIYRIRGWRLVQPETSGIIRVNLLLKSYPISTGIFAGNLNVFYYSWGIINYCPPSSIVDHAVQIVGVRYDWTPLGNHFKVKNSWGTGWGQGGFFYITVTNTCNICQQSVVPML